jgi:hypothetical protein
MSQSSTRSGMVRKRVPSLQNGLNRVSQDPARQRRPSITYNDAYLYALRVAYLAYLLQPRAKRTRHVTRPAVSRTNTSTSIHDLMKDFTIVRDSKSTKLPRGFIAILEKRLTGVLMGQEKKPEYQDALVKRTFAVFFNALSEKRFKESMEQDRRAEDLVLIFFSKSTSELQKGKPPGDESVKPMVDRHLALFVRLLSAILKDNSWHTERPELANRLATLENKLLKHDEDLASDTTTTVDEIIPLSYEVKDMPLVQVVARLFGLTNTMAQSDISKYKPIWTEKAALQDLKTYQAHLEVGTRRTLSSNDFDTLEAYDEWKRSETPELSQMMLAIIQANPELTRSTPGGKLPQFSHHPNSSVSSDSGYSEMSKVLSQTNDNPYVLDLPVDIAGLHIGNDRQPDDQNVDEKYTFMPPEPRPMYRFIIAQALSFDIHDETRNPENGVRLLSKESTELLNEIALRWRIPKFTRIVLFLDVIREKFVGQEISLDTLDAAFNFVKEPLAEDNKKNKRTSIVVTSMLTDRYKWTVADFALMQQLLLSIHEALQRDLYGAILQSYETKASPLMGPILTILDDHIWSDPGFTQNPEDLARFKQQVSEGLANKARDLYGASVEKEIPQDQDKWEFYHITQLGKAVLKLAERVQKRFRKNPEIMGVNPLILLLECTLPAYAEDSKAMIESVLITAKHKGEEVPIQDGFDLYKELSGFRRVQADALPRKPFTYSVEEMLATFVWRWIKATEGQINGWVENAIKQDQFVVRAEGNQVPTEDERHSVSVIDVFRSFSQIVDQISSLNWDDDLSYAKFMTALSKSVGNGVSRYCEIVEQMFSKEMDRLTPEQEAAATQTRQEKWMQLAKDTWNNKERIEPFQFYAQSFVKLNDINFAIRKWDDLEREVNVDACAEVIRKNSPPVTQRKHRPITNYVFTIKIVEGEDLKAMDVTGYSDPYVVLTDEYQKRLSKTRVIYQNLNPRWDESVDITTQGSLHIFATVWDWDQIGDHDYVGRTSLKLDPAHFGDFLPREYWLDLDTQGRILVRVSMEGERDDIQFYFGKAFRTLKRTEREMTRKITDKLSAYIQHCLSRRALRSLLSQKITVSSVTSYFNRNRAAAAPPPAGPTEADIVDALRPLFTYFDDNFAIMNQTLTSEAMIAVMTRLWKEVLVTIEGLLVPPLSDKASQQKPLTQQELDVVFKWLQSLFDFFHAVDEQTGEANGVPLNVLKSPKYHEIQTLNFFYFETTENLIRTSERMASATAASQQAQRSRLSAPASLGSGFGGGGLLAGGMPSTRRAKSIMASRNLGTMRKAKEEKWKQAQAEPSDDMILRILRMRPEATSYLRDRSRQKERLAAAAAAELIVKQSLLAGTSRMVSGGAGGGISRR